MRALVSAPFACICAVLSRSALPSTSRGRLNCRTGLHLGYDNDNDNNDNNHHRDHQANDKKDLFLNEYGPVSACPRHASLHERLVCSLLALVNQVDCKSRFFKRAVRRGEAKRARYENEQTTLISGQACSLQTTPSVRACVSLTRRAAL